jgi:precorrin-3B synthase
VHDSSALPEPHAAHATLNAVELWKAAKHGFDVWPDLLGWAQQGTPQAEIDEPDLQRMKWHGVFWRKHDRDRYMIRIRIPGCEMTADQARAVAFIAYEAGHGIVDVTTRGNVQVQGLPIQKVPGVIAALDRVGLTSKQTGFDNIRNVTSHPLAGVDPEELIDTRQLARDVTSLFVGNRELSDLPRKFNIALNGRPDSSPSDWTQDIAWLAARGSEGRAGFRLLIGGTQGQNPHRGWHVPVWVPPEDIVDVTYRILQVFREMGSRSAKRTQVRFRYLIERIGPDGVLVEVERRLGTTLVRFPEPPPPPRASESFVGWIPQIQTGRWTVGIAIPVGRLTWRQMEGLAIVARKHGDGTLRTAIDQNLLVPNVAGSARAALGHDLAALGLGFEADSLSRSTIACTGKQFCSLAVTETKGYAFQLVEELRRRRVETFGIRIAMSGCPNACAQHHTADIGLKGVKVRKGLRIVDGFDVYLGGGVSGSLELGELWKKGVPVSQLAELLERTIREFHTHRREGDSFSAFWRTRLEGAAPEVVATEEPPAWRCRECGYVHAAQEAPAFCPRCAALRPRFVRADGEALDSDATVLGVEPQRGQSVSAGRVPPAGATDDGAARGGRAETPEAGAGAPSQAAAPEQTAMPSQKTWRCGPCGYEHFGDEPPDICPVCGASRQDFTLVGGADAAAARPPLAWGRAAARSGRRILLVGGSIAGHVAAHVCREIDPDARITLVTDERHRFYNRLNLTRFLAGEVLRDRLFDYDDAWYADQAIEVMTEMRAIAFDPVAKRVVFASGVELSYDALVLAHGSAANVPAFYREDLARTFLLRTLADVERLLTACRAGTRAVVIGGGLLGLEAAWGLKEHGATVSVVESLSHLMPRQLDLEAGALLGELVSARGITPVAGVGVKGLLGGGRGESGERVEGVELTDGRRIPADLVLVSTGIRPNIDWVARAGIECRRGIVVDDRMATSAEDVYAAGDVAEWRGQVVGLWTNAIEQGKVAAANAAGKTAEFGGFVPVTILKCLGIPVFSVGAIGTDGDEVRSQVMRDPIRRTYRRLISRRGVPIGGMLVNTTDGMAEMKALVEASTRLDRILGAVPDAAAAVSG